MVGKSESQSSGQISFSRRGKYELVFQFWYCEPSVKNQCWEGGRRGGGREKDRRPNFVFFCSLECLDCHLIVLYRASKNRTFFVPSFTQRWGTQGESKISSFCFLLLIRGMRRCSVFKLFLHDPRDGKILLRSSTS